MRNFLSVIRRGTQRITGRLDRWTSGLLLANGVILVLSLALLRRFPPVFVDEAWNANRAWTWLQTGVNAGSMDFGGWEHLAGYWHFYPLLPSILLASLMRVWGVSLIPLRFLSWSFGVLLLVSVYSIVRSLSGTRRSGLLACLLVLTSYAFLKSSHLVRPDIYVAALGYAGLALVLVDVRQQHRLPLRSFLAGLLIAAGFEMHPNAVIFVPVVAVVCLAHARRRILFCRPLWAFAVSLGIGLAGYAWLHILPAPETYVAISRGFSNSRVPPLLAGARAILTSTGDTMRLLAIVTWGRLLSVPLAAAVIWQSRRRDSFVLVVMMLTGLAAFVLWVGTKLDYYAIYLTPLCDAVLAIALAQMVSVEGKKGFWWRRSKAITISILVASVLVMVPVVAMSPPPGDMEKVALRIARLAPQGSTLMGPQTYWFGLSDQRFLSWEWVSYRQRFGGAASFADAMQAFHPDILIIDDHLRNFIQSGEPGPPGSVSSFWLERWWSKRDLEALLSARGQLLDTITTRAYGPVEVYALTW